MGQDLTNLAIYGLVILMVIVGMVIAVEVRERDLKETSYGVSVTLGIRG